MAGFFTRERFGEPQFIAGVLLFVFLAQSLWLAKKAIGHSVDPDGGQLFVIKEGLRQWHGEGIAGSSYAPPYPPGNESAATPFYFTNPHDYDAQHSPLYYLLASAPLLLWHGPLTAETWSYWGWLARAPYLFLGLTLGASLWYVSRRLYGNPGGYIALTLYCFSPGVIRGAALWYTQPELGAAWGAFGAVFTAIAVAHTLYAPREVVLWNWRRILLLGLSLALAIGCQFSLIFTVPLALGFMLYLAPTRQRAAFAIWAAACAIGTLLLFAAYSFRPHAFAEGMQHAIFLAITGAAFAMGGAYRQVVGALGQISPALVFAVPVALMAFISWPRARYFGNSAPLLVAAIFLVLAVGTPHYAGLGFQFVTVPFLLVFVSGVFTDLLETKWRSIVMACLWGLLGANALWNLLQLAQARAS